MSPNEHQAGVPRDIAGPLASALVAAGPMVEQVHRAVCGIPVWPGALVPSPANLSLVLERVRGGMPLEFLEDVDLPEHLALASTALDDIASYLTDWDATSLHGDPVEFLQDAATTFTSISVRVAEILRRIDLRVRFHDEER